MRISFFTLIAMYDKLYRNATTPAYCHLCQDCDKVVRSILWQFRVRYCSKCLFSKSKWVALVADLLTLEFMFMFLCSTVDNSDTLRCVPWKRFRLTFYLPSVTSREQGILACLCVIYQCRPLTSYQDITSNCSTRRHTMK